MPRVFALLFGFTLSLVPVGLVEALMREQERAAGLMLQGSAPRLKYGQGTRARRRPPLLRTEQRVLVLGDSVTQGQKLGDARRWTGVAEAELRRRGHDLRLLNYAVPGFDIEQVTAMFRDKAPELKPHRVVYAAFTNDHIETVLIRAGPKGRPVWLGSSGRPDLMPLPAALSAALLPRSALLRRAMGAAAARSGRDLLAAQAGGDLRFFERWAPELVDRVRGAGLPLTVFLLPAHVLADPEGRWCEATPLRRASCEAHARRLVDYERVFTGLGVPVIHALPALRASGEPHFFEDPLAEDLAHPNAEGHRRFARAFVDAWSAAP